MAMQDDAQNTWDKVKGGFQERIDSDEPQDADRASELSPEDEAALSEQMGHEESGAEGAEGFHEQLDAQSDDMADPAAYDAEDLETYDDGLIDEEPVREYSDEDRA